MNSTRSILLALLVLGGCASSTHHQTPGTAQIPAQAANMFQTSVDAWEAGDASSAEISLRRLVTEHPDLLTPHINLAALYIENGNWQATRQAVANAIAEGHQNCELLVQAGFASRQETEFASAERFYKQCLDVDPNHGAATLNLGILYELYLGDPDAAAIMYRRFLAHHEDPQVASWLQLLERQLAQTVPRHRGLALQAMEPKP